MIRTILVADPEADSIQPLKHLLEEEGYRVLTAQNGTEAMTLAQSGPDLITLEVMIANPDGWEVARQLKRGRNTSHIPLIFLTVKESVTEEVVGFELGAADYITKPFNPQRLTARIRGILRTRDELKHNGSHSQEIISYQGFNINLPNYSVVVDEQEKIFPKKEFEVLAYLITHHGRVLSRQVLLEEIWGKEFKGTTRTVDVHIRKIREKLGPYSHHIETVKRVGYRFRE